MCTTTVAVAVILKRLTCTLKDYAVRLYKDDATRRHTIEQKCRQRDVTLLHMTLSWLPSSAIFVIKQLINNHQGHFDDDRNIRAKVH